MVNSVLRVACAVVLTVLVGSIPLDGQPVAPGVLRVQVRPGPGAGAVTMPRHVLLVSDNPASRAPWRLVVGTDGTGRVTLPPGNYTVESEEPLVFAGRTLEWRQTLDVAGGVDTNLTLTLENAEVGDVPVVTDAEGKVSRAFDPWDLLIRWQDSVVPLWTPTTMASGVVVGPGLIATNQRVVGVASTVEVQVTPETRVAAQVIASDAGRGVALLRVAATTIATRAPIPVSCAGPPTLPPGAPVVALGARPGGQPSPTPGKVRGRIQTGVLVAFDYGVPSTGGPVLGQDGGLVGLTSPPTAEDEDAMLMTNDAICAVLDSAKPGLTARAEPSATPLPNEPEGRVTDAALAALAKKRTGSLSPVIAATSDFDVTVLTPVTTYAGLQGPMDFGNWGNYVATAPPVLFLRVTPKQAERFWTKVARGAAMTQGIALPAFKQYKPGFASMRVTCDGREVVPIHPLVIERPISPTAAVREGFYAFAPDSLGPECTSVTLDVRSEKAPDRADTLTLDAKVREQIVRDFAEYRAALSIK